ncbi:acyltransferase family protein [Calidifontibacter indicus]|uniref:acyltransferase family protein n=1 Tax=Calidifontibacter indicus TaxID=419650 RepID=UPI003D7437E7
MTDSARAPRAVHWPGLDGLRGVAALAVVVFHMSLGPAMNGFAGVDVFFVLSGFLITSLLLGERAKTGRVALGRFYLRRVLRLYPALVVTCIAALVLGAATGRSGEVTGAAIAALAYVANWWIYLGHPAALLEHTWTLSIEEHFYLLWPVTLVLIWSRRHAFRLLGAIIATAAVAALVFRWPDSIDAVRASYLRGVPIVWGSLLAIALRRWDFGRARRPLSWLGLVASVSLLALLSAPWHLVGATGAFGASGLLTVLVVAGIATSSGGEGGLWANRVLVWLGRRSYGLYLYHFPILSLATHQLHAGPDWLRACAGLVTTLVVVVFSYRFVELPFLRLKDRRFGSSRSSAEGARTNKHQDLDPDTPVLRQSGHTWRR